MSDWWSRQLSNQQPRTAPRQEGYSSPPITPPVRFGSIQIPTQQQPQPQQTQQRVLDENRAPTENVSMGEAIRLWKGGEAAKKQGDMSCPDCGSQNIFVRTAKGGNTMISGNAPAPRCFECGWNGMYDQGSQSSWAV
jgi:hypothetical protein